MSKKLLHKINYYLLEFEDIKELSDKYSKKFNEDFSNEINFQKTKDNEEDSIQDSCDTEESSHNVKQKDFHDLYKKIARKTHPDLHGDEFLEDFKKANEAYNSEEWVTLVFIAGELGIEAPIFNEEATKLLEKNLHELEAKTDNMKKTISWTWCNTKDKNKKSFRKRVREMLEINEEEFEEYLKGKNC
jgi:hypothetical protein